MSEDRDKALQKLAAANAYHAQMLQDWESRLAKLKVTIASLQETLALRDSQLKTIETSNADLETTLDQLRRTVASNEQALAWRAEQVEELQGRLATREKIVQDLTEELEAVCRESPSDP